MIFSQFQANNAINSVADYARIYWDIAIFRHRIWQKQAEFALKVPNQRLQASRSSEESNFRKASIASWPLSVSSWASASSSSIVV